MPSILVTLRLRKEGRKEKKEGWRKRGRKGRKEEGKKLYVKNKTGS